MNFYSKYIKRTLDAIISTTALAGLSPVILVTSLLVRIKLGSPVIYKQPRPGLNERIFYIYKFRSMTNEIGEDGRLLPDAQRLTKFGKLLRASSLDELPELFNIIKGDMSLVGPRPLSIYYLPHYPAEFRRRHSVRPGLTGLAQVNGRNNLPWDERFSLDNRYIEHISFALDAKIILDTIVKVIKHSDITVRGMNEIKDYGPYRVLKEENNEGIKMQSMTYTEIGSYFWLSGQERSSTIENIAWLPPVEDSCFAFSGRNAIDTALRELIKTRSIKKAYLPSYCCVSMVQPFLDHGLKVIFYEVCCHDGAFTYQLPETDDTSVVLIMSYFGLSTAAAHETISALHDKGAVVIEDITHSLLSNNPACEFSDYLVASLRKWFAIPTGGWVGRKSGTITEKPDMDSNYAVCEKIAAMREKYDYLTGKIHSKESFLLTQAKFENDLIHADKKLKIDDLSLALIAGINCEAIIRQRRKNAQLLLEGLEDLNGGILTLPRIDLSMDTPLFLPIFLKEDLRDDLRKYLIDRGLYCPVHWPEVMGAPVGVRANELSLICDQRYSEGDMRALVSAVHAWARAARERRR